MKTIKYDFGIGCEVIEGSVEVEDDATKREIEAAIFDDATSCGILGFNWYEEGK